MPGLRNVSSFDDLVEIDLSALAEPDRGADDADERRQPHHEEGERRLNQKPPGDPHSASLMPEIAKGRHRLFAERRWEKNRPPLPGSI